MSDELVVTKNLPGCPWCGYGNAVAGVTGAPAAKHDDRAVCIRCGAVAVFTDDAGGRRRATPEETTETLAMKEAQEGPARVRRFLDDMKFKGIHVGVGTPAICAACDEVWPCSGAADG